ncbi:MAG: helix-turn-helix transcriptional regulator [Planctomycetota bacterium]|jgi:AraC-like DNA-binding protein|nr:helix-turn-helix transcriptional regulator [Planctomycetota bacterium]
MADLVFLHHSEVSECRARIHKRFQGYASLQLVSAGAVELFYGPTRHQLGPGWLWPCNPGPITRFHAYNCESWHHRHVAVAGAKLDHWRSTGLWPHQPQDTRAIAGTAATWDRMAGYLQHGREALATCALTELLLLLAEHRDTSAEQGWLKQAKLALEAGTSITDVAADSTMPVSTFRRRFHRHTGLSPQDYAIARRIDQARNLLETSDQPIGHIAEQLGYREVAFFSRQFRQRLGVSPQVYRDSSRDQV